MTETPRLYGVSFGDGNNGVSHMYASYYVRTNEPYILARASLIEQFKPGKGQAWARSHMDVGGEADYTIYATLDCPPCQDTEDGEYPELEDGQEYEDAEDGRNWSEHNGVWMTCEVYPIDDSESREGYPIYESIEDAMTTGALAMAREDES